MLNMITSTFATPPIDDGIYSTSLPHHVHTQPSSLTTNSLMSDYQVTLVNNKMSEFFVKFHGPAESESASKRSHSSHQS